MKRLLYKGIVFDNWEHDEDGGIWAEICQACVEKHWDSVNDVIDEGETARGCCSVAGCFHDGSDEEKLHFYIDFNPEFVSYEEGNEADDHDEQYL